MEESNIDKFDFVVGELFAKLYEAFPQRTEVAYMELNQNEDLSFANDESFEFCAVEWLERAGYIWIYHRDNVCVKAVLSPKGLEILKSIPDSLSGKISIGENLVSLFQEGAKETLKEKVKELVSLALSKGITLGVTLIDKAT